MKINLKLYRIFISGFLILTILLWSLSFKQIFSYKASDSTLEIWAHMADQIYYLIIPSFSIIILFKARQSIGNLMLAFLLILNSQSPTFQYLNLYMPNWLLKFIITLYAVLFSFLLFKSFQFFPTPLTSTDIEKSISNNTIRKILKFCLSKKAGIIFLVVATIVFILPYSFLGDLLFIVTLLIVILFLYLNLKRSQSDRNKVLWLFWGISIYMTIFTLISIFDFFNGQDVKTISNILSIISVLALLLAFLMSLFFYNTFDTGIIVKRTIVNSFMFISIIFTYNVSEHYFLHWLSHKLHLSDALVASIFSSILVMIFSPLHHRLMHFIEAKIKLKH